MFLSDNGIVMSCGRGDVGALGHREDNQEDCLRPKLIEELLRWVWSRY